MTHLRTLVVLAAVLVAPVASTAQDAPPPQTPQPAATPPPDQAPQPAAKPPENAAPENEEFIPSQEISADEAVTFPVDI
jgi:hypothetical protein